MSKRAKHLSVVPSRPRDTRPVVGLALVGVAVIMAITFTVLNGTMADIAVTERRTNSGDEFRPAGSSSLPTIGNASRIDRDCSDFASWRQAQRFFERNGRHDPHRLDRDGDGIACEFLRW